MPDVIGRGHWGCRACGHLNQYEDGSVCENCELDNAVPLPDAIERREATVRFLARVRAVARECGYAIAVHGSEKRDLDLIAAPWTPEAVSADQLVARLCEEVPMIERPANLYADPGGPRVAPNPELKPWGRIAWSLAGCPDHEYVDLSVAPRAGEPVPIR